MDDESNSISAKSFIRAADYINKVGYMDGAAEGQKASFQPSFDIGYKQGFYFGFELGVNEANLCFSNKDSSSELQICDPRRINCQICINSTTAQEDIVNLLNNQKEKNYQYLQKTQQAPTG